MTQIAAGERFCVIPGSLAVSEQEVIDWAAQLAGLHDVVVDTKFTQPTYDAITASHAPGRPEEQLKRASGYLAAVDQEPEVSGLIVVNSAERVISPQLLGAVVDNLVEVVPLRAIERFQRAGKRTALSHGMPRNTRGSRRVVEPFSSWQSRLRSMQPPVHPRGCPPLQLLRGEPTALLHSGSESTKNPVPKQRARDVFDDEDDSGGSPPVFVKGAGGVYRLVS